jgi:hypothetical protein
MGYYIDKSLVIEYLSINNKICKIITDHMRRRVFTDNFSDIHAIILEKYKEYTNGKMRENKYTKSIYDNKLWIKTSYKKKYEKKIKRCFHDIYVIKKIYKIVEGVEML